MGAGSFAAGSTPAGFDNPVQQARIVPVLPAAVLYDPLTRSLPLDANGQVQSVHPVDQEVARMLTIPLGAIAGDPDSGLDVVMLKRPVSPAQVPNLISLVVKKALKRLLDAGDIKIIAIEAAPTSLRRQFSVSYWNVRSQTSQKYPPSA